MSKSKGNDLYQEMLVGSIIVWMLCIYYLMHPVFRWDLMGTFTPEDYVGRINYELANDSRNLLSRTGFYDCKYFDSPGIASL